jgi:hypothetical protein
MGLIVDAGVSHGRANPRRHLVDLSQPTEMLEWERRSVGTADELTVPAMQIAID